MKYRHTKESRLKMVKNHVGMKGKHHSAEFKIMMSVRMFGKNNPMFGIKPNITALTRLKMSENHWDCKKKNNPMWRGGLKIEYPNDWKEKLKEQIRIRDDYICQFCDKKWKKKQRKFDVHHIDYDKKNCDGKNLITLCNKCHLMTNGSERRRKQWIKYFRRKLGKA